MYMKDQNMGVFYTEYHKPLKALITFVSQRIRSNVYHTAKIAERAGRDT
jgi:hypothetical protein